MDGPDLSMIPSRDQVLTLHHREVNQVPLLYLRDEFRMG